MHFVRSHISFVKNKQVACAISNFGCPDEGPDKAISSLIEIVIDG